MKVFVALGAALAIAVATAACGEAPASPTSPSDTPGVSPFAVQIGGLFSGSMTLTGVSGGECVGVDLNTTVGSVDNSTITITQDQSKVSAVVRSATTGLVCRYEGDASLSTFSVDASSCDAEQILFQCSNGASRVLELVGSTLTGSLTGNTTTGTVANSYNVFANKYEELLRVPIAGLVTQQQFTAARR